MNAQDTATRIRAEEFYSKAKYCHLKFSLGLKHDWMLDAETIQCGPDGIEFIEGALKLFPDNPRYLQTYALLLADVRKDRKHAMKVFQRALELDPENIELRHNIRDLKAKEPSPEQVPFAIAVIVFALIVLLFFLLI